MRLEDLLVQAELKAWRQADRRPRLWWRDDGARASCPQLQRLVAISRNAGIPLSLAARPGAASGGLSDLVNAQPQICLLHHGADPDGPSADLRRRIAALPRKIEAASAAFAVFDRYRAVYVAPEDQASTPRAHPVPAVLLKAVGFKGISGFGRLRSSSILPRVDVHLQLMDCRSRSRFSGRRHVLGRLAGLLRDRRRSGLWHEPIGLLTHHAAHDEGAWKFLTWLFAWQPLRDDTDWTSGRDLFVAEDRNSQGPRNEK